MSDKMPTPNEIAKLISEDVDDFGGPPMGNDMGMGGEVGDEMGGEEGMEYDVPGEEVEPITMDKNLLQMLLNHMREAGEGEEGMADAMADAALEHSKEEPVEDPDSEGIMTGERDFDEIIAKAQEMMGMDMGEEPAPDMGGEEGGEEMGGGEEEGGFPFESKENEKAVNEGREKFRKV